MSDSTLDSLSSAVPQPPRPLALTILVHPESSRLGEQATLVGDGPFSVSRTEPDFSRSGGAGRPLEDRHISRRPTQLRAIGEALQITYASAKSHVEGRPPGESDLIPGERLSRGVLLSLSRHVMILVRRAEPAGSERGDGIIGASPETVALRRRLAQVAQGGGPVLINGATGTGKELAARALHARSPRSGGPWVVANLAALPSSVAASQLFGHARGAFTGANSSSTGLFGQADGGTLFLDELGEAPAEVQPLLLRALESGELQVVGGRTRSVDVRVITATDADLVDLLASGRLRPALYHRFAGTTISLVPLRFRREDIALQLRSFVEEMLSARGHDPPPGWLSPSAQRAFVMHPWPGNTRQLIHAVRAMVTECAGAREAIFPASLEVASSIRATPAPAPAPADEKDLKARVQSFEAGEVRAALVRTAWNRRAAAQLLGVPLRTLTHKIKTLGIVRDTGDS